MQEKIVDVTVYEDRALVIRESSFNLIEGSQTIYFNNIPQIVIENSVRSSISSDENIKIESLQLIKEVTLESKNEKIKELEKQIEQNKKLAVENQQYSMADEEIYKLVSEFNFSPTLEAPTDFSYTKVSLENISSLQKFMLYELSKLDESKVKRTLEKRKVNKKHQYLQDQLNLIYTDDKENFNCKILVNAKNEGSYNLKLSYLLPKAGWTPFYEARLLKSENVVEMNYFAHIFQNTGENWDEVVLSLSTAKPSMQGSLPVLTPWYVDFFIPPPLFKKSKQKMFKDEDKKEKRGIAPEPKECEEEILKCCDETSVEMELPEEYGDDDIESIQNQSTTEKKGLSVNFNINGKETIPPDGTNKKTLVKSHKYPVSLEYVIVPSIEPFAFIKATIKNTEVYPLLKGNVFVYHNTNYIGKSILKDVMPNEEFSFYMGKEETIKVEHFFVNKYQSKKGLANNTVRLNFKYKTKVINYQDETIKTKVFYNIPVSNHSKLKVKLSENSEGASEVNEKGVFYYEFKLKSKEEKELFYEFYIEYPKGSNIHGIS